MLHAGIHEGYKPQPPNKKLVVNCHELSGSLFLQHLNLTAFGRVREDSVLFCYVAGTVDQFRSFIQYLFVIVRAICEIVLFAISPLNFSLLV